MIGKNGFSATIIFLGNGRCYHTLDWFRSAQKLFPENPPLLATDLIEGESFKKLIRPGDFVHRLLILDAMLFRNQSRMGDLWRNILKFLFMPVQVLIFRKLIREFKNPVVHAHSMYYVALARFSSCKYVATPQGSEVLVRPFRSKAYKWFSKIALSRASQITVDSDAMKESLFNLYAQKAHVIQNGIDLDAISRLQAGTKRDRVVSIRGFSPNYQIGLLLKARNQTMPELPISFCYPFIEESFKSSLEHQLIAQDQDIGRLPHLELYQLLLSASLVVSIPVSDSSPRSVYESIFCGCIVAVTKGGWLSMLPPCMLARIIVVNLDSPTWFKEAYEFASSKSGNPYRPSTEALKLFDQKYSMKKFYEEIYPQVLSK